MQITNKKLKMNLAELIEWGFEYEVKNKQYFCNENNSKSLIFNSYGNVEFSAFYPYLPSDTFTVEIEEELTESTVIPKVIAIYKQNTNLYADRLFLKSINEILKLDDKVKGSDTMTIYIMNDDGTLTLVWTKEKG